MIILAKKVSRSISIDEHLDTWIRKQGINISSECEKFLYSLSTLPAAEFKGYVIDSEIAIIEAQVELLSERMKELKGKKILLACSNQ